MKQVWSIIYLLLAIFLTGVLFVIDDKETIGFLTVLVLIMSLQFYILGEIDELKGKVKR